MYVFYFSSESDDDDENDFRDLNDDPLFEMNNFDSNNKTTNPSFHHKILNNDFFAIKDKTNNL